MLKQSHTAVDGTAGQTGQASARGQLACSSCSYDEFCENPQETPISRSLLAAEDKSPHRAETVMIGSCTCRVMLC